jgi:hypothetical protein
LVSFAYEWVFQTGDGENRAAASDRLLPWNRYLLCAIEKKCDARIAKEFSPREVGHPAAGSTRGSEQIIATGRGADCCRRRRPYDRQVTAEDRSASAEIDEAQPDTVTTLAGPARAADLPAAPPPMKAAYIPAPVFNWTGCYVGGNVGFGWQQDRVYDPLFFSGAGSDTATGVVGGGQIGCDWQTGPWVFGFQGVFDGTGLSSSHLNPLAPTSTDVLGTNTRWFATQTARIGMTVTPQALFYVKGGAAEASFG